MQNERQVRRDLSYLVAPQSPMSFDIQGARRALGVYDLEVADAQAQRQYEADQAKLATESKAADTGLVKETQTGQFDIITDAEKAGADLTQEVRAADPTTGQKSTGDGFTDAVVAEGGDTGQLSGVPQGPQTALNKTKPEEKPAPVPWEASGLPGSTTFADPQGAYKYFKSINSDMTADSIAAFVTGDYSKVEKGLVQTTGPLEFAATGLGSMGMMALNQSRKVAGKYLSSVATRTYGRYVKNFAIGSPAEMALTIGAEEIGEDHPFVGIAAEVLFGVGTGVITDLVMDARKITMNDSIEWAINKALYDGYEPDVPSRAVNSSASTAGATNRPPPPPPKEWTRAQKKAHYESYEESTMRGGKRDQSRMSNLARKSAEARNTRLRVKVAEGDLRDPETRAVVQDAINHAKQKGLKSNQAEAAHVLQTKIDKFSTGQKVDTTNEIATAASPIVDPGTNQIPTTPVPPREDVPLPKSEEIRSAGSDSPAAAVINSRMYIDIRRRVAKEWYGPNNEDFEEDVVDEFNRLLKAAREAGSPVTGKNAKALQDQVRASKTRDYAEAIDEETWELVEQVKRTPWTSQAKRDWVRGGSDAEDRWAAPEGGIVARKVDKTQGADNQSAYEYADWDITDHFVINEKGSNLTFAKSAIADSAPKDYDAPHTFSIDYGSVRTLADAKNRLGQRFTYWQSPKQRVFHGKGKAPDFPAAGRLLTTQERYNPKTKKFFEVQALPDRELDAIAELYGWNDNMLAGYKYTDQDALATVHDIFPDQLARARDTFYDMEVTNKGWFNRQNKLPHTKDVKPGEAAKTPKFYELSGAISEYRKQRTAFLEQVSEGEIRRKALWEYDAFKNGRMTDAERVDQAIAHRMADEEVDYDTAATQIADEAGVRIEEANFTPEERGSAGDLTGTSMGGTVIEPGIAPEIPLRDSSTGAATSQGISRFVYDMDDDMLNAKVMEVEDHFEVRFADSLWNPSAGGGDGKINIWRVNTMDDLNAIFMRLDQGMTMKTKGGTANGSIKSLAEPINTKLDFGIVANKEHSVDMVQRMGMVMKDAQTQMSSLASRIVENPSDVSASLAWNKLKVIHNLMSETMVTGRPGEATLKALQDLNMNGNSNAELLERVMKASNNTMPAGADGMPNPNMMAMQAEMFAEMPNGMRKTGLLTKIAKMQGDEMNQLYQGQRRLASILKEACG